MLLILQIKKHFKSSKYFLNFAYNVRQSVFFQNFATDNFNIGMCLYTVNLMNFGHRQKYKKKLLRSIISYYIFRYNYLLFGVFRKHIYLKYFRKEQTQLLKLKFISAKRSSTDQKKKIVAAY